MRKSNLKKWLSLVLCLALLAAAALSTVSLAETATETAEETVILMNGTREEPAIVGEGELSFLFQVIDPDGNESWFQVLTDEENLADALVASGLAAGSDSEYGLFVTSVCGIELIWTEENPHYWALYVNDEYAQVGPSSTPIEDETIYAYRAE